MSYAYGSREERLARNAQRLDEAERREQRLAKRRETIRQSRLLREASRGMELRRVGDKRSRSNKGKEPEPNPVPQKIRTLNDEPLPVASAPMASYDPNETPLDMARRLGLGYGPAGLPHSTLKSRPKNKTTFRYRKNAPGENYLTVRKKGRVARYANPTVLAQGAIQVANQAASRYLQATASGNEPATMRTLLKQYSGKRTNDPRAEIRRSLMQQFRQHRIQARALKVMATKFKRKRQSPSVLRKKLFAAEKRAAKRGSMAVED